MNMGTASVIRDIGKVIAEIKRVLVPGGRFFLSFYNREALLYQWDFLPWPTSLAAEINHILTCLDVHVAEKVFSVFAQAYTTEEVMNLLAGKLRAVTSRTFPTLSPVLPNLLLDETLSKDHKAGDVISAIDLELSNSRYGAYIVVTGTKELG